MKRILYSFLYSVIHCGIALLVMWLLKYFEVVSQEFYKYLKMAIPVWLIVFVVLYYIEGKNKI